MTSDRRFFSGDSLAQALNQAAQYFQIAPTEINYKLVEKRHGFLKVRRKVVIEVDGADPGRAPSAAPPTASAPVPAAASPPPPAAPPARSSAPTGDPVAARSTRAPREPAAETTSEPPLAPRSEPAARDETEDVPEEAAGGPEDAPDAEEIELPAARQPAKTRFPSARGEEAEAAGNALAHILGLAGLELESEILQGDEELLIELWGSDQDILLRDRGRLLLAIQHLLPRVIRGLIGRSVACKVDSDDFHMIREERLRDLAQRAADEVRHRGRPKTLEPMSPDERRIVHLTLADYSGIETESHGSGLFKRVMVRVSRGEKSRDVDR